jgi:hypothetical protein
MFFRKTYPIWVCYDFKKPDTLFVNTDMLSLVLQKELNLPGIDELTTHVVFALAENYLREHKNVDPKWNIQRLSNNIDKPVTVGHWLTQSQINNIETF